MNALITAQLHIASPLGPIRLARSAHGLCGLWFIGQKHEREAIDAPERPGDALLQRARRQLDAYWAGRRREFDLPLAPDGTPFQLSVWRALRAIGFGSTRSYGEVASSIGAARAVRAVGAAIGRNPLGVIVPCHRVVGSGGSLTGYAGGLDRKRHLLELEGVLAPA